MTNDQPRAAALVADLAEAEGITLAEAARRLGAALTSDAPPLRITSEPDVAALPAHDGLPTRFTLGDVAAALDAGLDDLDQTIAEQLNDPHFAYLFGRAQALADAERALSYACTGAVLEDHRWWRPAWSSGQHHGLTKAVQIVNDLRTTKHARPSGPDA